MGYTIVLRPAPGTPPRWSAANVGVSLATEYGRLIRLHRRMPEVRLPVRPSLSLADVDLSAGSVTVEHRTVMAYATGRYEIHDGERAEVFEVGLPSGERAPAPLPTPGTGVFLPPPPDPPDVIPDHLWFTHEHRVVPGARVQVSGTTYSGVVPGPGLDAAPMDPYPSGCWSCDYLPGLDALDGLCDQCWGRLTAEGGE